MTHPSPAPRLRRLVLVAFAGVTLILGACSSTDHFDANTLRIADAGTDTGGTSPNAPVISDITPPDAKPGDSVTIVGENFLQPSGTSYIQILWNPNAFMNVSGGSWTGTQVTGIIPDDAFSGNVIVSTGSTPSLGFTSNQFFYAVKPRVASISPASGSPGANVSLLGSGFDHVAFGNNTIYFGTTQGSISAVVVQSGDNQISASVPTGITSGTYNVYVAVSSASATTWSSETVTFTVN